MFQELDKKPSILRSVLDTELFLSIIGKIDVLEAIALLWTRFTSRSYDDTDKVERAIVKKFNDKAHQSMEYFCCGIANEMVEFKQLYPVKGFVKEGFSYTHIKECIRILIDSLSPIFKSMDFKLVMSVSLSSKNILST